MCDIFLLFFRPELPFRSKYKTKIAGHISGWLTKSMASSKPVKRECQISACISKNLPINFVLHIIYPDSSNKPYRESLSNRQRMNIKSGVKQPLL